MTKPDMPPYESRAWDEVQDWKRRHVADADSEPPAWQRRLAGIGAAARRRFDALPGAEKFAALFAEALNRTTAVSSRTASASVRRDAVLEAYRKRGHEVHELADIHRLSLSEVDAATPRLDLGYIVASAAQGAGTGLAVSAGQVLAAGGAAAAGAGAAPGVSAVVGALAVDAAAVMFASHRAVAHVAAYYGYDVDEPAERLVALGVLGVGTANRRAKAAAYAELNRLVLGLARDATWHELSQNVVTAVVGQVYTKLGLRLSRRKLAQAVPLAGVAIGAGLNARTLSQVVDEADNLYRERFLRDAYALEPSQPSTPRTADPLLITDIIDAEIVEDE